jgi:hypothetical protein
VVRRSLFKEIEMPKRKIEVIEKFELADSERETHMNLSADDRTVWQIFSDDPKMIEMFDGIADDKAAHGAGYRYTLQFDKLIWPKPDKKKQIAAATDDDKKSRKHKQTFGEWFVRVPIVGTPDGFWERCCNHINAGAAQRIMNLKQLRDHIELGDHSLAKNAKIQRWLLNSYRAWVGQAKAQRT